MTQKQLLLFVFLLHFSFVTFAQFSFVHISDLHISTTPIPNSDVNAAAFQCYMKEFVSLSPTPLFILVSGDISNMGNMEPDGMYPSITKYLYPPAIINPGIGVYFADSAKTIPVLFTPGNHEYWESISNQNVPISNDTLKYYTKHLAPSNDYTISTDNAVIVVLRSGSDVHVSPSNVKGTGLSNAQCSYLRKTLTANKNKRKLIVMHHPAVNVAGTNSDGTPITDVILSDTTFSSITNNRTTFLNICDSNYVDVVLGGHFHQNVVADRQGHVIPENQTGRTRFVQTAAAFNRSYRIITVNPSSVTVSIPQRSCLSTEVAETGKDVKISVFPNPASDMLTLECPEKAEFQILDLKGRLIKTISATDRLTTVNLEGYSNGLYIIKAQTKSTILTSKFLKQ